MVFVLWSSPNLTTHWSNLLGVRSRKNNRITPAYVGWVRTPKDGSSCQHGIWNALGFCTNYTKSKNSKNSSNSSVVSLQNPGSGNRHGTVSYNCSQRSQWMQHKLEWHYFMGGKSCRIRSRFLQISPKWRKHGSLPPHDPHKFLAIGSAWESSRAPTTPTFPSSSSFWFVGGYVQQ